ncbi:MAG: patatin-like phospholipase family protein [Acidobacteria bacterium]|nr:patatin-like phospholipase family protein [Acidobacteriota bacterium]MBI3662628.1 patatin-like phospholipase family protein [Acidobacteriota bacterium]
MDEKARESAGAGGATQRSAAPAKPMVEGCDAVCFTAGLAGAAFGAGTIHAYLAADRDPPAVAAGISLGALNAAAMQRVYQELEAAKSQHQPPTGEEEKKLEAARWRWFRQYVEALSDQPLNVFWDAIPDQSDFFADMVPIHDTSAPAPLASEEREARRRRYLLVRLGQWLAQLPVTVGLVAGGLVNYVRFQEKYPLAQKLASGAQLIQAAILLLTRLISHACASGQFFPEHKFAAHAADAEKKPWWGIPMPPRKGMAFLSWLNLFNFTLAILFGLFVFAVSFGETLPEEKQEALLYGGKWVAGLVALLFALAATNKLRRWLLERGVVKHILLPAFGWLVYLISLFNVMSLTGLALLTFRIGLELLQKKDASADVLLLFGFFALLVLPCLLLSPFVMLPETRRWLIDRGFLQPWKRPLFGWRTYGFLWLHLISLVGYVYLGLELLRRAMAVETWPYDAGIALRGTIRLLAPLLAIAVPFALWKCRSSMLFRGWLRRFPRPLAGWIALGLVAAILISASAWGLHYLLMGFKRYFAGRLIPSEMQVAWRMFCVLAFALFGTWVAVFGVLLTPELSYPAFTYVLNMLGLRRGLIHDYFLRRKLLQLFDPEWKENARKPDPPKVLLRDDPLRVLLVAAPLPTLYEKGDPLSAFQLWARTDTPLIHALRTAMAAPPFFEPTRLRTEEELKWWLRSAVLVEWMKTRQFRKGHGLDLVDGGVIRQNPLPALFSYLRSADNAPLTRRLAEHNDEMHPAIHVVYRVPLEGRPEPDEAAPDQETNEKETEKVTKYNIVDVAKLSLRLSARRDTQLEVLQTNTISRMETAVRAAGGDPGTGKNISSTIFADEIAPEEDLQFKNTLNPSRQEMLKSVAAGCRRTLETLYRDELGAHGWTGSQVHCDALLVTIAKQPRVKFLEPTAGLPEVCQQCTRMLKRPPVALDRPRSTVSLAESLEDSKQLVREMPWLSGETPRIVLVASGGVFRGAFHIGMLAALMECNIRPDLIVGASVGTLMGGALGAMFQIKETGGTRDILGHLLETFLQVDDKVALTKTLKGAAREMGLRGRSIHLSPRNVRRILKSGSRSDPGFAAAGAPAALIDAISDLFMIPHQETANIAAEFVAGHVTHATNLFLQQLKEETLERLDIERAVIGTSLLEPEARELLGAGCTVLTERQPFKAARIAFYGTTTNLVTQSPLLLGGGGLRPGAPYDYVEASLASSAFPAVFTPRSDSNVFPGSGRADILYSDGGMFDNLPFMPAIEILSRGQQGFRRTAGRDLTALQYLSDRHKRPDLLIAGALNALPEEEPGAAGPFETLAAIHQRAASLENNVKIRSFEYASKRIHNQIARYVAGTTRPHPADTTALHPADRMVDAAVLPVFPASPEHLNGTFAFCASTGLNQGRVLKSIADGCYQTMLALARAQVQTETSLAAESIRGLTAVKKIPAIKRLEKKENVNISRCPFFKWNDAQQGGPAEPRGCPFAKGGEGALGWGVYKACGKDSAHSKA